MYIAFRYIYIYVDNNVNEGCQFFILHIRGCVNNTERWKDKSDLSYYYGVLSGSVVVSSKEAVHIYILFLKYIY